MCVWHGKKMTLGDVGYFEVGGKDVPDASSAGNQRERTIRTGRAQRFRIPGISYDGGCADYGIAPFEALASVPDDLGPAEAAPLLCAGITTFNAPRNSGVGPGDLAAILGIGGLGHLGVQFAAKMGCRTVAIARGADKEPLARKLGAHHCIDNSPQDVASAVGKLGGARVILATVTNSNAMSAAIGGLAVDGKLIVLGASPEPIEVSPLLLISDRRAIQGRPSGTSIRPTSGR